jgi:hypothetical protein
MVRIATRFDSAAGADSTARVYSRLDVRGVRHTGRQDHGPAVARHPRDQFGIGQVERGDLVCAHPESSELVDRLRIARRGEELDPTRLGALLEEHVPLAVELKRTDQ